MIAWHAFVGFLSVLLSVLTTAYGGNLGFAIITFSFLIRLALLPLTLRMARRVQAQQKVLREIKPKLDALKSKYKSNPQKLATELSSLYHKHGVKPLDGPNSVGMILQLIIGAGVYSAIRRGSVGGGRFLWIRNLAKPNAVLAIATAALTLGSSLVGPHLPQQSRAAVAVLPALLTLVFAWRLASGVVLYWAASTTVSGLQGVLLARDERTRR